eukprot:660196-Prorocentrum_minimum.AAC.3
MVISLRRGTEVTEVKRFDIMVLHGPLSPTNTYVDPASGLGANRPADRVGEDISIVILAFDVEGNEYTSPDVEFRLELEPYPETAAEGAVNYVATSYHDPAGGTNLNRFVVVIPGVRVSVMGMYKVRISYHNHHRKQSSTIARCYGTCRGARFR